MHPMNNSLLSIGAIVLGVLALVVGVLYLTNTLGYHPTRAYFALGAGAILVVIGIVWMAVTRRRDQA